MADWFYSTKFPCRNRQRNCATSAMYRPILRDYVQGFTGRYWTTSRPKKKGELDVQLLFKISFALLSGCALLLEIFRCWLTTQYDFWDEIDIQKTSIQLKRYHIDNVGASVLCGKHCDLRLLSSLGSSLRCWYQLLSLLLPASGSLFTVWEKNSR